jgi:hypothetical protein
MSRQHSMKQRGLKMLAVAALTLGATVAASAAEVIVEHPRWRSEVVTVEPPVVQTEVIGVAPHPGWVYQNGYWDWVGGKHVWVRGAWVAPRPGYRWEPHVWVREGGGWRLREGYWVRL